MNEINPLSKILSPLKILQCGEDTISVQVIFCGTILGSFPVLVSFAVQFGDHLRTGIICGPVQFSKKVFFFYGVKFRAKFEVVLQKQFL